MMWLPATLYVAIAPVNLRLSFDRLAGIVRSELGGDPRAEAAFVFHNRRGTHVKILWFAPAPTRSRKRSARRLGRGSGATGPRPAVAKAAPQTGPENTRARARSP